MRSSRSAITNLMQEVKRRPLGRLGGAGRVLLLVALLSGCAVDQAKEIAKYRAVLDTDDRAVAYTPGEPLTLEMAVLLANQHNERLGLRGEQYLQALIDKDRAVANFLPTISLAPTY